MAKTSNSGANSLKEYLKRYESNVEEETKTKKKKKKKPRADAATEGGCHSRVASVLVVDEDPVWQKPVKLVEEEEEDSADEEQPQVDEDIEVKRMKRLEFLRSKRPYHSIADDGSGWVSMSSKCSDLNGASDDLSPPRMSKTWNGTPSPEPGLRPTDHDNGDASPPRRRQARWDTSSPEPNARTLRSNATSEMSPPRRKRVHSEEPSPGLDQRDHHVRKRHFPSDDDISPPRKQRVRHDTPPSEQNQDTRRDSDLSPPRQRRRSVLSNDQSFDISPPRRSNPKGKGLRNEEKSGRKEYSDLSPRRKDHHGNHTSDLSPPRKSRSSGSEQVPPDLSPPRKSRKNLSVESSKGPKTGLISGQDISKELTRIKKDEQSRFQAMDSSLTGRGAEPVYRDKVTGRRLSKEELVEKQKKVEEKPKEIKLEWGKGLAQKRAAEEGMQELELEKDKPFARTRDDPDLDTMLKDRIRWGDPMAHLVKKKHPETMLRDLGDGERMKESGFVIPQEIPTHSWLKRGLDTAPNRYGIQPGRHWDGVDRSNGSEKELFKRTNEKRASEREAYLWSVSDM